MTRGIYYNTCASTWSDDFMVLFVAESLQCGHSLQSLDSCPFLSSGLDGEKVTFAMIRRTDPTKAAEFARITCTEGKRHPYATKQIDVINSKIKKEGASPSAFRVWYVSLTWGNVSNARLTAPAYPKKSSQNEFSVVIFSFTPFSVSIYLITICMNLSRVCV